MVLLFTVRRRVIWRMFFLSLWTCLVVNVGSHLLGPVIIPIIAMAMALGGGATLYHHVCKAGEEDTLLLRTSSLEEGITSRMVGLGRQGGGRHPKLHFVLHPESSGGKREEGVDMEGSEEGTDLGGQAGGKLLEEHTDSGSLHLHVPSSAATSTPNFKEAHATALTTHHEKRGRVSPQTIHGGDTDETDFGGRRKVPHGDHHNHNHHHGNIIFVALLSVCTVVNFWLHPFLFYALVPPCIWLVVKYLCSGVVWSRGVACLASVVSSIGAWVDVVMPVPLSSLATLFVSLDQLCTRVVKASLGSLVSVHIILGLVLVVVGGVLLLGFETQVELRHFGSVVMSIWNSTVAAHPHLSQ